MTTTITIPVELNAVEMNTEDLERVVEVFGAEMRRRQASGDSAWRPRHFRLLLDRLADAPQARVLREAAGAEDGYVSRERVMELLGRDPSRRLNGFRKPIAKAVAALATAEPGFPVEGSGPLWVDYADGVSARGFYVDAPDRAALRAAVVDEG